MATRTPTYYSGTITGQAGTLITVLDAILVTGEGWTKTYSGTNKAVYTQASGSGFVLRVVDDGSLAAGAREATVRGAESASDVDTLTDSFPTTSQLADADCVWRKSNSADSTTRTYYASADDKTLILWIEFSSSPGADMYCFGDLEGLYPGESYLCFITNRATGNNAGHGLAAAATTLSMNVPFNGYKMVVARSADGLVKSEHAAFHIASGNKMGFTNVSGLVYPNTPTNKVPAVPVYVTGYYSSSSSAGSGGMIRGAVPFVFDTLLGASLSGITFKNTWADTAYDASSSFIWLPCGSSLGDNQPRPLLQTAGTWDIGI